ncbi:MAG: hypothetical protein ACOCWH_02575, partial [Spirochaetota bacterium]
SDSLSTTIYDQRSILQRMKEIITLPFFIIISAVVSIVVMNLLSVPVLTLVLSNPELYTKLISWGIVLLFAASLVVRTISRLVFYIRTGLPFFTIVRSIFLSRLTSLFLFIFSVVVIIALAVCLIYLFQYNSMFINTMFD